MMNQIQTVRAIFNRMRVGEPLRMSQIQRQMRQVNPHLPFTRHGPYEAVKSLVKSGELVIIRKKPLAWARTRLLEEQPALPLAPPQEDAEVDHSRVRPYALQDVVRGMILAGTESAFTSKSINAILRWSHPDLWRTMSPSSTYSTLAALEHEGLIERTGRRRGRCIEWRRRA